MKQLITGIVLILGNYLHAQCKICYSLEDASKSPREVEELHLSNAAFAVIDTSFNQFTSLHVLNLAFSPVMEVADKTSIPSLKKLNLSNCSYNPWKIGAIGKAFPNLEELDLSSNNLCFIWSGLQSLYQLIRLDVSNNQLINIPVEMMYLSKLKELNLSQNDIKLQANELGALWALERLDITSNPGLSTNNLVLSIAENKQLKDLSLDGDLLTSSSIQQLSQMKLDRLEMARVNEPSKVDFTRFPTTRNLSMIRSSDWLSAENSSQFDQISKLELTNSPVPAALPKLKSLNTLVLNQIEESQIPLLYPLKKLGILDISNTDFTKSQIAQLKRELPDTKILCSTPDVTENMRSNNVSPLIEIPAKKVSIQSGELSVVNEKNVSLTIPKNAFLDKNGTLYNGKVNVELTVYDDAIQTALAGIPMTFNENGQEEIFASNGMLRFEAKGENGEELQPNPSNVIQASLGNLQPQNPGGLYAFNATTAQWTTISDTVSTSNLNARILRATDSINQLDLKNLVPRVYNDRLFSILPHFSRLDRTEITLYSKFIPSQENKNVVTHNRSNASGRAMTQQTWVIDTIVSPEMKKQLKVMKKETRAWHNKKFKDNTARRFIPRLMNRLDIAADPSRDNYRLTFYYRDSLVSLPVALSGISNKQIQKNTLKFQAAIKQAALKDRKERLAYEKSVEEQLKTAEKNIRENLIIITIARLQQPQTGFWGAPNQLNFGLTTFGLVNCDFFMRRTPEYVVNVSNTLKDQHGEEYPLPNSIISVDPLQNYYMETSSNFPVSCFRSTYLVFDLGKKKLGISRPQEGQAKVKEITVIDITDKKPEEISKAILSI
ncbi:Leucine Rich repeats (2 copies) [compost metagenome]